MPHTTCDGCGLLGDVGEFFSARAFVHGGVSNKHRVRLAHHDVNAKRDFSFFGVEDAAQLAQGLSKGARDAGNHRVGLIHLQQ